MPRDSIYVAVACSVLAGGLASCATSTIDHSSDAVAASPFVVETEPTTSNAPYDDAELRLAADARRGESPTPEGVVVSGLFDASTSTPLFEPRPSPPTEASDTVVLSAIDLDPPERPIDLDRISRHLESMASVADDPVSVHFARALLPLFAHALGKPAMEVDDFETRADLTETERQLLHQTAQFATRARSRLAGGEGCVGGRVGPAS